MISSRALAVGACLATMMGCGMLLRLGDEGLDPSISCDGGVCGCAPGLADCEANEGPVCETDLAIRSEHCGACGHRCGGGTCRDGRCEPATAHVSRSPFGSAFAADGDQMYVPDPTSMVAHTVLAHKGSAPPVTNVVGRGTGAALAGGTLFYSGVVPGAMWQIFAGPPEDPSAHTLIAQGSVSSGEDISVAGATAGHVLVTAPGKLFSVARTAPSALAQLSNLFYGLTYTDDRVFWSGAALDQAPAVFMLRDGDRAPIKLASALDDDVLMAGLATDGDTLYYTTYRIDAKAITVWQVRVADKTRTALHELSSIYHEASMGMDDDYLYLVVVVSGRMSLVRIRRAAPFSAPRVLADVGAVRQIRVTDRGIYWSSNIYRGRAAVGSVIHYLAKPLDE